jgi:hypothetical protein
LHFGPDFVWPIRGLPSKNEHENPRSDKALTRKRDAGVGKMTGIGQAHENSSLPQLAAVVRQSGVTRLELGLQIQSFVTIASGHHKGTL